MNDSTMKKRYPSRYSDDMVTAAQHLAEIMCERQARKNSQELTKQFWNLDHWKKPFKSQLFAAYGLLKLYPAVVLVQAIYSKQAEHIYSLRSPVLDDIVKQVYHKFKLEQKTISESDLEIIRKSITDKPRQHPTQNTTLGKLNELDEE